MKNPRTLRASLVLLSSLSLVSSGAFAQTAETSAPDAQSSATATQMAHPLAPSSKNVSQQKRPAPPTMLGYYWSTFAGPVADKGDATKGGGLVGVSFGGVVAHNSLRAFTFPGFDMELAAIKPTQPSNKMDGIFSFNLQPAYAASRDSRVAPYLTAGYSRVFSTGNALNYGTGINFLVGKGEASHIVRIEARDYWTFSSEHQHLITLRIAFAFGIPDV